MFFIINKYDFCIICAKYQDNILGGFFFFF